MQPVCLKNHEPMHFCFLILVKYIRNWLKILQSTTCQFLFLTSRKEDILAGEEFSDTKDLKEKIHNPPLKPPEVPPKDHPSVLLNKCIPNPNKQAFQVH